MRSLVLLVVAACGSGSTAHLGMAPSDGGVDAAADAAADAAITYSISVGSPDVVATPVHSISVAITGAPNTDVMVTLDRATAGALPSAPLTLDASGAGTVMFTPCYALSANCLGPATLTLTDSTAAPLATTNVNLVASPIVGDVAPCQTTANVLYLVGNDNYLTGPWQSTPLASWWVGLSPDTVQFQLSDSGAVYDAEFSGFEVPRVLAPGIFEDARPYNAQIADHPALCIQHDGVSCSPTIGRFQIHEYASDPQTGALGSTTISFEQLTNPSSPLPSVPPMIAGCVHYQHALPSPATPPTPDPTKVSVQVFGFTASGTPNGLPDPTARAIFTATDGTVVLDTIVNAFGQAEASMPTGGTVTTIQFGSGEQIRSYRGVVNGNHFVISAGGPTTGVEDQMLMTAVAPANTALGIITSCGDVTHANPPDRPNPPVRSILHFYDGCRSSTFNMLTMAGPAAGGDPTQFLWQTNLPHVPTETSILRERGHRTRLARSS